MTKTPSEETKVAVMQEQIKTLVGTTDEIKKKIEELTDKLDDAYVKQTEFDALKRIVVGEDGKSGMMGDINYLKNYKGSIVTNTVLQWGAWGILVTAMMYHIFASH